MTVRQSLAMAAKRTAAIHARNAALRFDVAARIAALRTANDAAGK